MNTSRILEEPAGASPGRSRAAHGRARDIAWKGKGHYRSVRWWYAIALFAAAGGCHGPPGTGRPAETPQRDYELHCLGCHGAHGEGAWGPNIQGLKRTDEQIIVVIANGQGKMPAFKGHLSEQEMRELSAYVKTFHYKP